MRRVGLSIGAFIAPTLFLLLMVRLLSILPISGSDLVTGNWSALGLGWESLGTPIQSIGGATGSRATGPSIISADGGLSDLYVATSDKRVFAQQSIDSYRSPWTQVKGQPSFDQSPQIFFVCSLFVADGEKLYSYQKDWTLVNHPLEGPIRDMVPSANGILMSGDTQILYSNDCGKSWQEIWHGQSVESNLADSNSTVLFASHGKLMARGYTVKDREVVWNDWQEVSGSLSGQDIRFVAFGPDGTIAATESEVFRAPASNPPWNWESFSQGLPAHFQIESISSRPPYGRIGLITDQGLFTYYSDGQWDHVTRFGEPNFFLDIVRTYPESTMETTYIIAADDIWMHQEGHDAFGTLAGIVRFLEILAVLFVAAVVLGLILGIRTWRRLGPKR